ncbi:uncharacterized protein LOC128678218 [Plodia interpunctella]|uniref:uncharacterized protein LOC128678218 n=1 Tax=Plodia interpunctella TaxID=58824 RepID=UPI00236875A0|nr:uncharacterized protein LOC128678218 [Plodia interpunctella]
MFRTKLVNVLRSAAKAQRTLIPKIRMVTPLTIGFIGTVYCEDNQNEFGELNMSWSEDSLEHEFLIRQATTVNVNAATQLLTVTLVAIHDTSERLREALTKEICLVKQALEWGESATPPQHWDELVAVRGSLRDLKHNLRTLFGYMDYAEKLATVAAEISYLSGNTTASDAICERIDQACRTCNMQKQLTHELQQESLALQQAAIISSPQLQDKLEQGTTEQDRKKRKT